MLELYNVKTGGGRTYDFLAKTRATLRGFKAFTEIQTVVATHEMMR